jgi:hypothetical protein
MREDADYNQRQYQRILDRIDLYRSGRMSLPTLIADVEGLISALEGVSHEWRNTLLGAGDHLRSYTRSLFASIGTL